MAARAMLATTRAFATQRPLLAARAAAATRLGATKQRTLPYVATRSLFGFGGGAGGDDEDPESKKARRDVARAVVDAEALASSDGDGAVGSNGGGDGVLVGGGGGGDDGSSPASVGVGDDAPRPERVVALGLSRRPLFPGMVHSLSMSRAAAEALTAERDAGRPYVGLFLRRDSSGEDEGGRPAELLAELGDDRPLDALVHATGAFAQIHNVADTPDGNAQALVLVHRRVDAERVVDGGPPPTLAVAHWDREARGDLVKALSNEIVAAIRELVQMNPLYREHMQYFTQRVDIGDPFKLADFAASLATAPGDELQTCLEERDVVARLRASLELVSKERELSRLQQEISSQVEKKLSGQQRTFLLNEQLKTIKKELGVETDDKDALVAKYRRRAAPEAKWAGGVIPALARHAIEEELAKLAVLEKNSAEFNVTRSYLDWLTALPWGAASDEAFDVAAAKSALDAGHYGMDDVKERILELVAVGSLVGGVRGKILCLVGPPGTGKTSIGESVAAALGREFYRFSVGGLGDVAEIKGHRRTYVGAMPGKPIQCLKQTRAMNPVILIDEVDKLGRGGGSGGGDPASALLELLDPSQNATFLDHYLDVPVDLSRCLFVCTANDESTIPGPLLDRMEVVRLAGYDLRDKLAIARDHLVPRALKEAGLDGDLEIEDRPRFTDAALEALAKGHAREAGVRNLQKLVEKVARKLALRVVRDGDAAAEATRPEGDTGGGYVVDEANLDDFVGPPRFSKDRLYDGSVDTPPGVVAGLAWTSMGGATLYVEATKLGGLSAEEGKPLPAPRLTTTGQLGGVMEESSRVALNYVRGRLFREDSGATLDGSDLHVHFPDGATPKDGPSAGVTLATALLSLASGIPARQDLAMTGEISLTGKVLPVGGIKEKVIAARRANIPAVILPAENRKDFDELPDYLKDGMEAHFATTYDDVFDLAFKTEG
ncbi:hypothetical protein AURANDRAFT_37292 [Aureococcus anophagefferens]|uniref:Lon protease homolog n=1 Tax=Aureococcus anophagefferens TaxID=44056 RepID=F0Y6F4_AURAN|nr:hypothetical protein AURANDRAFT_37292 [Aureococcus anophagefferens]EGB09215.1 hypothetical protein AURANDRAFT_37292 [Aureococcus anophagefferens]|eukprot:XP_009036322.1 hypothetical protein AURANDRAFT_37292 [Aureococcus anophagefferens]